MLFKDMLVSFLHFVGCIIRNQRVSGLCGHSVCLLKTGLTETDFTPKIINKIKLKKKILGLLKQGTKVVKRMHIHSSRYCPKSVQSQGIEAAQDFGKLARQRRIPSTAFANLVYKRELEKLGTHIINPARTQTRTLACGLTFKNGLYLIVELEQVFFIRIRKLLAIK